MFTLRVENYEYLTEDMVSIQGTLYGNVNGDVLKIYGFDDKIFTGVIVDCRQNPIREGASHATMRIVTDPAALGRYKILSDIIPSQSMDNGYCCNPFLLGLSRNLTDCYPDQEAIRMFWRAIFQDYVFFAVCGQGPFGVDPYIIDVENDRGLMLNTFTEYMDFSITSPNDTILYANWTTFLRDMLYTKQPFGFNTIVFDIKDPCLKRRLFFSVDDIRKLEEEWKRQHDLRNE